MSVEQRIHLKFLVYLGKTPTEALKLLQEVYGDDTMSKTRLFEWHRRFKEGREELEDLHRSGGLPHAEQMKMLSVWDKKCGATAVLLLE